MSAHEQRARDALRDLHDPLARIQLAASQLCRAASAPGTRHLADRILHAVRDLDRRLQESIATLSPPRADEHLRDDCREAVREAVDSLAPVLLARGIELVPPALPDRRVCGDGRFARRAVLQLLRAGGRWARNGGELAVTLRETHGAYGIELRCRGSRTAPAGAFEEAHRFARTAGAELVTRAAESGSAESTATLWRRRGAPAT